MSVLIVVFCVIGAYSLNNSMFDVGAMVGFGILGYALRKAGYDVAPLLLAFVLGSMFEQNLRQGLIIGYGSPFVFLKSPISAAFLGLACVVALAPLMLARLRPRVLSGPSQAQSSTGDLDAQSGTETPKP
jgi:putative tricarboxylic transport membrane protein